MLELDGSYGEGGGQLVRTAVALSAITGRAVTIRNVRANRDKPGLAPQHVAAVRAVAALSDAGVEGVELRSRSISFSPRALAGGSFRFDVGTAGSLTLLLQALLRPCNYLYGRVFGQSPGSNRPSGGRPSRRFSCLQEANAGGLPEALHMYKHILIPTDGSKLSEKAIKKGVALARALGARVTGLTATRPFRYLTIDPLMAASSPIQYERESRMLAKKALDVVSKAASAAGVPCACEHVVHREPFQAIVQSAARRRCDLIVMASHGRRGVAGVILGSETAKVLTHSKIPVLVCR